MVHHFEPQSDAHDPSLMPAPRDNLDVHSALVSDGFTDPNLAPDDVPPPYGETHTQLQFSQPGFEAGAAVTDDGRVNISINQKSSRLSEILGATFRKHAAPLPSELGPRPPAYIPSTLGGAPGQTPPPRLNVVIQIVGSRGDVQPFVALGKVLKDTYGHRVRVATHPTFQAFVEENDLEFFSIGGDPAELMAFMVKHPGLMPGIDALKTGEVSRRRRGIEAILMGCWRSCVEPGNGLGPALPPHRKDEPLGSEHGAALSADPTQKPFIADAIIANPPSFAHIHIAEKLGLPLHMMFTMPWSPTRSFPHPLANITSTNTDDVMTNHLSYALVEMMTWQGLGDVINRFRSKILDLEPLSLFWAPGLLTRLRIPYTYCWSPSLIPKPNDWRNNIDISGFFFLDLATSYTPDPELAAFLEAGPPPIYIGFGSIVVDDPNALTRIILDAVHISGVRALVSQGWGGLGADEVGVPPGVFMIGNCPHDWLFQRVSCVVHHGGAGTMAAGVRAGKPTVVVPFFGDQPFWGAMIERAGAGPAPIPYKDLTGENLAGAIMQALKPETAERAQSLGRQISEERGSDVGGKSFHDHLNVESLRCSLSPSRVGVWRVRRTKVRLSSLAAAVLVSQKLIVYSDLKLWRPRDYNTDGEPWDPISAATASLVGDISGIALAITDFPRGIFQGSGKKEPKDSDSKSGSSFGLSEMLSSSSLGRSSNNQSRTTLDTVRSGSTTQGSTDPSTLPAEVPAADSDVSGSAKLSLDGDAQSVLATPSATETRRTSLSETATSQSRAEDRSRDPVASPKPSLSESPFQNVDLQDFRGAGTSVRDIVTTGVKSPMNFCLGLAKGFRNAPRLYNDDTVRPAEKVTDMTSGLRVAGKEFGYGLYDGVSGLVTQPLKGAQKEGGVGLIKGFGRGLGGIVMKPAAAAWSLPAYTMQGAYMALRNRFTKSVENYIAASRVIEGGEALEAATPQERADILAAWNRAKFDLQNFYALKLKEAKGTQGTRDGASGANEGAVGGAISRALRDHPDIAHLLKPRSGSDTMGYLTAAGKRALKGKDSWKRSHVDVKIEPPHVQEANPDDEFERAIRASVLETSRGDAEEDARVEKAIRASVHRLQRAGLPMSSTVAQDRQPPASTSASPSPSPSPSASRQPPPSTSTFPSPSPSPAATRAAPAREEIDLEITDEEYQALVEKAMHESAMLEAARLPHGHGGEDDEEFRLALERSRTEIAVPEDEDDEELRKALELSKVGPPALPPRAAVGGGGGAEDEELKKAIEASEALDREKAEREKAARAEEEIVMAYVMRQSLQEEEYRRARESAGPAGDEPLAPEGDNALRGREEGTGKGKGRQVEEEEGEYEEDEDELRRAVEMSMRVSEDQWSGSGPGPGPGSFEKG